MIMWDETGSQEYKSSVSHRDFKPRLLFSAAFPQPSWPQFPLLPELFWGLGKETESFSGQPLSSFLGSCFLYSAKSFIFHPLVFYLPNSLGHFLTLSLWLLQE
jgi:hypothetical protein